MEYRMIQDSNDIFESRWGCTLNYYDNKLYLYGGKTYNLCYNEMWMYCLIENKWNEIDCSDQIEIPPATAHHRCVNYREYIILFGGVAEFDDEWVYYNDIYVFNCDTNKWKKIITINPPVSR